MRAQVTNATSRPAHVVLVVAHSAMRALIIDLLDRDGGRWTVTAVDSVAELADNTTVGPVLVVVDTADFAAVRRHLPSRLATTQVVVIGPEPDPAYRQAALSAGAAGWLSREHVAEELCDALRAAPACVNESPPTTDESVL